MSKSEESNPFYCNDDFEEADSDHQELQQTRAKIDRVERQQLQSLDRTLRVCHETEDIGFRTAEEMVRQTEVLENTEKKLDSINEATKVTQRHITSIRSVFGALKNRLFTRTPASEKETKEADVEHSRLKETLDEFTETGVRSSRNEPTASSSDLWDADEDSGLRDISHATSRQTDFDSKLGDISASMGVLKNLAKGMNVHLEQEEQLLGRIGSKSQQADLTIEKQNKQLRSLLK